MRLRQSAEDTLSREHALRRDAPLAIADGSVAEEDRDRPMSDPKALSLSPERGGSEMPRGEGAMDAHAAAFRRWPLAERNATPDRNASRFASRAQQNPPDAEGTEDGGGAHWSCGP